MTAVSDETGREPFQSPQHLIEGIILRRLHDKRIEGYTLEMSKEIEAALSAAPVAQEPVAIQSLEWAEDDDNGRPMHRARTDVGPVYTIYDDGFSMPPYRLQIHQLHLGSYYNVGPAKDAAQADYEKRIRSALSIPPATSAGLGADEIARVFVRWKQSKNLHESLAAQNIEKELLALLSRGLGSDQQRSQKDGSR